MSGSRWDSSTASRSALAGPGLLRMDVTAGDLTLASGLTVEVSDDATGHGQLHGQLLDAWWQSFCADSYAPGTADLEAVPRYLVEMLARRLELDPPARPVRADDDSDLERQFERTVGMLFGFESVRLAMMDDESPAAPGLPEAAVHPLPQPLQVRGAPVPASIPNVPVEGIALAVPEECFYLRCGRVKNYLWVRHLIQGWGGSLDEVVATASLDQDVRRRLERHLAFDPQAALDEGIDEEITDCALIGGDVEFRDGAAIGVVFAARPGGRLSEILGCRPTGSTRPCCTCRNRSSATSPARGTGSNGPATDRRGGTWRRWGWPGWRPRPRGGRRSPPAN